jgi:hypothetical protein
MVANARFNPAIQQPLQTRPPLRHQILPANNAQALMETDQEILQQDAQLLLLGAALLTVGSPRNWATSETTR